MEHPFYGNAANGNGVNGNGGGMYNRSDSDPVVRNCILWGDTATNSGAEIYNDNGTSVPVVSFSDVQGGYTGTGNRDWDPLFADAAGGDFHLQSTVGRWDPATDTWVTDAVTSPVIDRGDPSSDFSTETSPNGGRINMGAYGGTAEASQSNSQGFTVNRSFNPSNYTPEEALQIFIQIVPHTSTSVYAVEDSPPSGWLVSNINNSGMWDDTNKMVKWNVYFDNTSRTFTYQAIPPASESGTKTFYGNYAHNGISEIINAQIDPDVQMQYEISGHIETSGGTAISGVVMNGLPGSPSTDGSGKYSASVDSGWSGTGVPSKTGYIFSPLTRPYSGVTSDQTSQDYTGTPTYTISGYVKTLDGTGIDGVTMEGLTGSPSTNVSGYYSAIVDHGWSGTVIPTKAGFKFTPSNRGYISVTANQSNQDYTGTPTYTISGYVRTVGGTGISGVVMSGLPSNPTTDTSGFYVETVTSGWSGIVIPTKSQCDFSPSSTTYSNVTSEQIDQNYIGTQIPVRIYGYTTSYEPNTIIHLNNLGTGEQISVGMSEISYLRALEVSPTNGDLYGLSYDDDYLNFYHIDVFTGEGSLIQEGIINIADSFVNMAFDPNGNLYAITTKSNELYSSIYQVDTSTGDPNFVDLLIPFQNITAFAIDSTGRAIIWDKDTKWLIEVNLANLSLYPLGYLDGDFNAFDYAANDVLYGWRDNELYEIDLNTPEAVLVHTYDSESKGFACILQPKIKVLKPTGGEVYREGTEVIIQWINQVPIWDIMIEYTLNGGSTWAEVVPSNIGNSGIYNWIAPEATSDECFIRVSDGSNPNIFGINNYPFAIYECQGPLTGDLNNDCYVDMKDFVLFCQNWLQCRNPYDESCMP